MAIRLNRELGAFRTSTNVDKAPRTFPNNNSSARKFAAKDQVTNYEKEISVNNRPNAEYIVDSAAGLQTTVLAAVQAAATAREESANIKNLMSSIQSDKGGIGKSISRPTEEDYNFKQNKFSDRIIDSNISDDENANIRLRSLTKSIVKDSTAQFFVDKNPGLFDNSIAQSTPPQIDHISVDMNRGKGSTDCFYSSIVFSISKKLLEDDNVKLVKIFRSQFVDPKTRGSLGRLSVHGIDRMQTSKNRTRSKNSDTMSAAELRLREAGIDNTLTSLIAVDSESNKRTDSTSISQPLKIPPQSAGSLNGNTQVNEKNLAPYLSTNLLSHLDRSVSENLNAIKNIRLQNPSLATNKITDAVSVGRHLTIDSKNIGIEQLKQTNTAYDKNTNLIIDKNNSQSYKQIALLSPDKLSSRVVGDFIEFKTEDQTISYGMSYRYYISTVDSNMKDSVRSRIVEIHVDGMRIPNCPKHVTANIISGFISLTMTVDDLLVEKFEIYRKTIGDDDRRQNTREINVISNAHGYTQSKTIKKEQDNGFIQIGEAINSPGSGASFRDVSVKPGNRYVYRIYSVDIFGNKSECPREIQKFVNNGNNQSELKRPSLMAEMDAGSNGARITFNCDDELVEWFYLKRKDLTVGQTTFSSPGEVNRIKFGSAGSGQGQKRFEGEILNNSSLNGSWNGVFRRQDAGQFVFIDKTIQFDHAYQYQIYGVDRFGNKTSAETSQILFSQNRAMLNTPVDLDGHVEFDEKGPTFIKLRWDDGNSDVSAEDRLSNREDLQNTSVRTLYQVERRKVDSETWYKFPLVEGAEFIDFVADKSVESPDFRPSYAEQDKTYLYRVQSFQTGGFISNFTTPLVVFVGRGLERPLNFSIKSCDTKCRPFFAMLNWDTDPDSGLVDRWQIERAVLNNFAASRLNLKNPAEFNSLSFSYYKSVYKEASRFMASSHDKVTAKANGAADINIGTNFRDKSVIVGMHHYLDADVNFGNTYFYRIKAIAPSGKESDWAYRGIKITDDTFEKKQNTLLTQFEKTKLLSTPSPISVKGNYLSTDLNKPKSSYAMTTPAAKASSYTAGPVPQKRPPLPPVKPLQNKVFIAPQLPLPTPPTKASGLDGLFSTTQNSSMSRIVSNDIDISTIINDPALGKTQVIPSTTAAQLPPPTNVPLKQSLSSSLAPAPTVIVVQSPATTTQTVSPLVKKR